jgi:alpha-beta hydrolase superfamily lysophospholipase
MTKSILLIHGAFAVGSVWNSVIPAFESAGFVTNAPTLFPELRCKDNPKPELAALALSDYVSYFSDACVQMTKEHGEKPVIIGHSMGGLIAQKLAEKNLGSAAIFITPAAPLGCQVDSLKTAVTFLNILLANDPKKSYRMSDWGTKWGVLNRVPVSQHRAMIDEMVYESGLVLQNLAHRVEDPNQAGTVDQTKIQIPTLTIGAALDRTTVIQSIRKIALKYATVGGDYKEYPENGHMIFNEPGADKFVTDILGWLASKG